MAFLDSPQSN